MPKTKLTSKRALMIFATAVAVACGGGGAPEGNATNGSGGSAGSSAVGSGGSENDSALSDAQILKVLDATHAGKIAESKLAIARSANAAIVDFATTVGAAHEQAKAELASLAKQRSITPAESRTSLTRTATSNVELGNLMATSAADFDAAYLQGQLADHERVITLVASLLTMSSDAAVKEQLNALSTLTKGHQTQAKSLRSSL